MIIPERQNPEKLLPLTPTVFHILLALTDEERHGYSIMKTVAAQTDGHITMGPGTLYGSIKRMVAANLIVESDERPDPEMDDSRRRYYCLSGLGTQVLALEAARLAKAVQLAQQRDLLPPTPARAGGDVMAQPPKVQTAVRIYTALLWLYPRAHRQDYGPLMAQLFQDQCREAYAQRHPWGVLLWLRTLWDLGITAAQEHLHLTAELGLANQQLTPLPWRQVLLALLPGLWIVLIRTRLLPWSPVWLEQGWVYLASGLLLWSWWRERRLARWVYPIASLAIYGLPLTVAGIIFQQDGRTPPSSVGRVVLGWLIPLAIVVVCLGVLWTQRRHIRFSIFTWLALSIFIGSGPVMGLYASLLVIVPAALGLLAASRDRLYAAQFVLGIAWWFADGILDPSYAILIWTDVHTITRLIELLPTLFILILPAIWVLRARTTHQQLVGMTVFPFIGMALAEIARFLTLYNTARGESFTMQHLQTGLSSVIQLTAMLALVGITFAQFATSPTPATER